jgi:hypothetical protein
MMNPRFLLRIVTTLAICLMMVSCFGVVLWVIDEIVGWDILPDAWSLLVRALLVAGGIVAFVLVVMNVVLSLSLLAEASASRAQLPDFQVSRRWRRRFRLGLLTGLAAVLLAIAGLQVTDQVRANAAARAAQAEFNQVQAELDSALPEALALFTAPLQDAIAQDTLTDQSRLRDIRRLFSSIQTSLPHSPFTKLLVKAASPYDYKSVDIAAITVDGSRLFLSPEYYASFPTATESEAIAALFSGQLPQLDQPLSGRFLSNTVPSTWGVLQQNDQVIALVYLEAIRDLPNITKFHHSGPDELISQDS